MVNQIVFTQFAKNKLKIIHKYYSENVSEQTALKLVNKIVDSTSNLLKYPESGSLEIYENSNYKEFRSVKWKKFKLIYVIKDNQIAVVNIFDMRQNPNTHIKEMEEI